MTSPIIKDSERGAALLTVLLLVSVIAVIAATSLDRLKLATRLTGNVAAMDQARAFLLSAEDVALAQVTALTARNPSALTLDGDWQGKAGGYSIQGPAGAFIPWISGSYTAIVGLPLAETAQVLAAAGWPVWGQG